MRYRDSIFANLLKPIDRRGFKAIVAAHNGDAYDKTFDSWDHPREGACEAIPFAAFAVGGG